MNLAERGIAVYCSSSDAVAEVYRRAAEDLGRALAHRGAIVIYGGGAVGLMGVLADAALAAGGRVVGVIPHQLVAKEVGHSGLTELIVIDTMHQRKAIMSDRASAFVILPGGFGTYEEFFEVIAWRTLGIHDKPIILVNVEGFFDPVLAQIERAVAERMIRPEYAALVQVARSADEAIALLEADPVPSPMVEKWF